MTKVRIALLFILCFCLIGCNDTDPSETVSDYPLETMVTAFPADEIVEIQNSSGQDPTNSPVSTAPDASAYDNEQKALIEQLRALPEYFPQWYGGVNPETARLCVENGADVLVAGSDVFKAPDRAARIAQLRG